MSPTDIKTDSKTIRISNESYNELVTLSGFFSAITGEPQSISDMADLIISSYNDQWRPFFMKIVTDPAELAKYRQQAQMLKNQLREYFKDVKVIE